MRCTDVVAVGYRECKAHAKHRQQPAQHAKSGETDQAATTMLNETDQTATTILNETDQTDTTIINENDQARTEATGMKPERCLSVLEWRPLKHPAHCKPQCEGARPRRSILEKFLRAHKKRMPEE